jgi:formylglycine-generating enzyme required for sulfatase activity
VGGAAAWWFQAPIADAIYWSINVRPFVLTAEAESNLRPLEKFQECSDCPEMTVLPKGSFRMGALPGDGDITGREYEDHVVTLENSFAVSTTPVTFEQFTACAENGDCVQQMSMNTNDNRPAVNVTWAEAREYAAWLSHITGKPYRLLSEAEYEYAARGGMPSRYPWGESAGKGNANCADCNLQASIGSSPVGTFPANGYGLRDVVGNVFQWVDDCFHPNYSGAPVDGSTWNAEGCSRRVVRGASYLSKSSLLRSSWRDWREATERNDDVGFRVARDVGLPQD